MRKIYEDYHLTYLRLGWPLMSLSQLTRGFNKTFRTDKTEGQIRAALTNHGIKSGRTGAQVNQGRSRVFTADQDKYIRKAYTTMSVQELTESLNEKYDADFTQAQVKGYISRQKILSGRTGCFKKGEVPWNQGLKGYMGANSTSFSKGSVPANRREFGQERIDSKDGYILTKVDEVNPHTGFRGVWKLKHHVVWEAVHGKIPKGYVVAFVDGDKKKCEIENLELRSRAQMQALNRHGYNDVDAEMQPTVRLLAEISLLRGKLRREHLQKDERGS